MIISTAAIDSKTNLCYSKYNIKHGLLVDPLLTLNIQANFINLLKGK